MVGYPDMTQLQPAEGPGKAVRKGGEELPVMRPELSLVRCCETFQAIDTTRS